MAPRSRKRKDDWLCQVGPRISRGKSAYEWRPRNPDGTTGYMKLLSFKRDSDGHVIEDIYVRAALQEAYEKALRGDLVKRNMAWLLTQYTESAQFAAKAIKTRTEDEYRIRKRVLPVFGKMMPGDIKKAHIRQFMDKVGISSPVAANRDLGFLSRLFNWAEERGHMDRNPAQGVSKFPEAPRDRYPEDWEYDLVAEVALTTAYQYVAYAMEFAYLCRMRKSEVLALDDEKHILEDGIFVERGKGSSNEITKWSPRLRAAYDGIKELNKNYPTIIGKRLLFKDRKGLKISDSAFNSAWRRVRDKAMTEGLRIDGITVLLKEPFNFHDLKAKGVTDHKDKASGHKSKKMQAVYDRKPSIIDSTR